jgi:hypothetical protein
MERSYVDSMLVRLSVPKSLSDFHENRYKGALQNSSLGITSFVKIGTVTVILYLRAHKN